LSGASGRLGRAQHGTLAPALVAEIERERLAIGIVRQRGAVAVAESYRQGRGYQPRRRVSRSTAGYDPYDPRQTRDVPARMDVLGRLAEGIARVRIGSCMAAFSPLQ
jgi:hypothetical protein